MQKLNVGITMNKTNDTDYEIISLTDSMKKLLKEYSNSMVSVVNTSSLSNSNGQKLTTKVKKLFELVDSFCVEIDGIMNNLKKTLTIVHKILRNVLREDNVDVQKNETSLIANDYEKRMKCMEDYVSELEGRLKESLLYLNKTKDESKLKEEILNLKHRENNHLVKIKSMSDEWNNIKIKFSKSEEKQKYSNQVISELQQPNCDEDKSALSLSKVRKQPESLNVHVSCDHEGSGIGNKINPVPHFSNKKKCSFKQNPMSSGFQPKAYSTPLPRNLKNNNCTKRRSPSDFPVYNKAFTSYKCTQCSNINTKDKGSMISKSFCKSCTSNFPNIKKCEIHNRDA
ncbi:uncharacterized protein LOC126904829 isoform X2 [Daktulosphaira vitifoliae]|uniref:uncharacterized protein LOC126904829 isoform X2 n=1 Tax=Daktulosphaira vitifoliae TaxID=58002 RepID=UPI0021AA323F|nr:uncharacterized protein LOC126904829 isoform X2 [Daktulosphaira vitifoliae]